MLLSLLFSYLFILALHTNGPFSQLDDSLNKNHSNLVDVLLFAFSFFLSKRARSVKNTKIHRTSLFLGILFALLQLVGYSLDTYGFLDHLWSTPAHALHAFAGFVGYGSLFYSLLTVIYSFFVSPSHFQGIGRKQWLPSGKKAFFAYWLLIFCAWIPYFLAYFPGIITQDSASQILQGLGHQSLINAHPVMHTLVIKACLWMANLFHSGATEGIAFYSILQMLWMSCVFAFALWYLTEKKIPTVGLCCLLLFYALFPVNAMYSITMWKDQPFSCFFLLLVVALLELIHWESLRQHSPTNLASPLLKGSQSILSYHNTLLLLFLSMLGLILFRNGVVYILLLAVPLLLLFFKTQRKQLLVLSLAALSLFAFYKGPVFTWLNAKEGSVGEALSIPLQQFARVIRDHGSEVEPEDIAFLEALLPGEESIGTAYTPHISDPVKARLDIDFFNANRSRFLSTWLRLLRTFPGTYLQSFLANSYGYWYPETDYWVVLTFFHPMENVGAHRTSFLPAFAKFTEENADCRSIPIVSLLSSTGFYFLLLCSCAGLAIVKKTKILPALFPVFILWAACLASPVYAEFRYAYGMVLSTPFLFSLVALTPSGDAAAAAYTSHDAAERS